MPNWAKLELSGHLGRDAELRYTASGKAVCTFTVAYNPGKKEDKKPTVWLRCIAFGDLAAELGTLGKGEAVEISSASPSLNKWTDKEGKERESLEWLVWEARKWDPKDKPKDAPAPDDDIPW